MSGFPTTCRRDWDSGVSDDIATLNRLPSMPTRRINLDFKPTEHSGAAVPPATNTCLTSQCC
jgi:hypothetical protein